VSFAAITLCVASQRVIPTVSIYIGIGRDLTMGLSSAQGVLPKSPSGFIVLEVNFESEQAIGSNQ
jgi:hypothetical protein